MPDVIDEDALYRLTMQRRRRADLPDLITEIHVDPDPGRLVLHRLVGGEHAEHESDDQCWCEPLVFTIHDLQQLTSQDVIQRIEAAEQLT